MRPAAIVFDLYGTLIDISSLGAIVAPHVAAPEQFVQLWRDRQLALAFAAGSSQTYADFDQLTARALDETATRLHATIDSEARAALLAGWTHADLFADVEPTVAELNARGLRTAVLTNGTARSARALLSNGGMTDAFDAVLTADTVQRYKPEAAVYALVTAHYHCAPHEVVFISSNDWDASGAARVGFRSIWCNRGATGSRRPERTITGLAQLLPILENE